MVTKDKPKDKAMASTPRDVTTAAASKLFEKVRQNFWHVLYLQFQKEVYEKNYRRVTTQVGSQKQIKQNIFYEIKHMSLSYKHVLMLSKLQYNIIPIKIRR